eukprot:541461-Hanusia_phi.AAC.1
METSNNTSMRTFLLLVCISLFVLKAEGDYTRSKNTGFAISSIQFDIGCMNYGCWKIEVDYILGATTSGGYITNVLYLPRIDGTSQLTSSGVYQDSYTTTETTTFQPSSFPCGGASGGYAAACCLQTFHEDYRPTLTFDTYVQDNVIAPNCSTVSNPFNSTTLNQYFTGQFSGMNVSQA